jgi:tetratricopeptide (TPR) repeat protein
VARKRIIRRLVPALLAAPLLLAAASPTQLARAVNALRAQVAQQPGNADTLNDLANLLVEAGELEEAEETYRRAMALGPEQPEPPFNLALLLTATDHPREARRLLKAMLAQHPDHAWGHYQLGTLEQARGNRSRALHQYREAFRLDPELSDPHHNPHVLDNNLATAAMLEAFSQIARTGGSARIYADPARIADLLLPPLTAAPAPVDKPAMEEVVEPAAATAEEEMEEEAPPKRPTRRQPPE